VLIHQSPCPSSIGNCGKGLLSCLSCGAQSSNTSERLQDRGCKCVGVNKNKDKKSFNRQILTNDSAASNYDNNGYLEDSSTANNSNRKNPTEDSVSNSQNNPAEDHVANTNDVKYDVNNSCESPSDLCGDLAVNATMGYKNSTTKDSATEDSVASFGNKKKPTEDSMSYSQNNPSEDRVAINIYSQEE
jgi:hypothetical protein